MAEKTWNWWNGYCDPRAAVLAMVAFVVLGLAILAVLTGRDRADFQERLKQQERRIEQQEEKIERLEKQLER